MSIISCGPETDVDLANSGGQDLASVTRLGSGGSSNNSGGFAIVWAEDTGSDWSITGQIYGADGQPIGTELTFATGIDDLISLDARQTRGTSNAFTVTWNDGGTFERRVFDNSGTALGDAQPATGPDGEYWAFLGGGLDAHTVFLNVVGDDVIASIQSGGFSYEPFAVNTTPVSGEVAASVTRIGESRFSAAWSSLNGEGEYEVRISSFSLTNPPTALQGEILVDTGLGTTPIQPEIVGLNDGGFMVLWVDGDAGQIEAREFSSSGTAMSDIFVVNDLPLGNTDDVKISGVSVVDGRVVVTWETSGDVLMKILDPRDGIVVDGNGGSPLYGGPLNDQISGLGGDDRLFGWAAAITSSAGTTKTSSQVARERTCSTADRATTSISSTPARIRSSSRWATVSTASGRALVLPLTTARTSKYSKPCTRPVPIPSI